MGALYQAEEIPSYFVEYFYHEKVLDFVKCSFFLVCWDDLLFY